MLGCGAVVVFLLLHIGPGAVLGSFRQLSWRLLIVIVFPCVVLKTLDTLAWRFAFPHDRVALPALGTALLAGQAVGSTPASMIGGNATMAWMLRDRVSLRERFSSLIIVQTTSTASQGLFLRHLMADLEPPAGHPLEARHELPERGRSDDGRKSDRVVNAVVCPARQDVLGVAPLPGREEFTHHPVVAVGGVRSHRV